MFKLIDMLRVILIIAISASICSCATTQPPAKVASVKPSIKRAPPKYRSKPQINVAKAEPKQDSRKTAGKKNIAAKTPAEITWGWPAKGNILTRFSANQTFKGIDIGGTEGTPIFAAGDGEVVYSGNSLRGYGNLIIIKHNKNFLTAYAHNRINVVKEGDRVTLGQRIAEMGQTGADKVKLHFEVRYQGKPIDPQEVLPPK